MLFCAWILAFFLHAADAHAMMFTPTNADVAIQLGTSVTQDFSIENDSAQTKQYVVELYDVTLTGASEGPQFAPLSSDHATLLTLSTRNFTLGSHAARVVLLSVSAPTDASADSFVVGLVVREVTGDTSAMVLEGVSSLVFVTIGTPRFGATLETFSPLTFSSHLSATLLATIHNDAERVVQPFGAVNVRSMWGKIVAQSDMNPSARRVLAGDRREFAIMIGDTAKGNFFHELWREITEHRFGIFTATLVAAPYSGMTPTLFATTHIVVVPWRTLSCLALVFVPIVVARKRRVA